ncbi:MAG TPA: hypothetical protein VGM46_11240 [Mesorhizobium sp.]
MNRVLTYILRFAVILIGYMVATLAASAFIQLLFLGSAGLRLGEAWELVTGSLLFSVPFTALFVGYFAFLPAVVLIVAGEVLGQRNWLFYALAGAAVGLAVAVLFWQSSMMADGMGQMNTDPAFSGPRFVGLMIGGGIVGGLAYWLCAGRSAGNWRVAAKPTSPER